MDKTEATVGDTLTFSASYSGIGQRATVFLWVMKEKERVAVLYEAPGNKWTYEVTEPGTYWGQAIFQLLGL